MRFSKAFALTSVVALMLGGSVVGGAAKPKKQISKPIYIFEVAFVKASGAALALRTSVARRVRTAITKHPHLAPTLPPELEDVRAQPKIFKRIADRMGLRAFNVTVEIGDHAIDVERHPRKSGHIISAEITLNIFGENMPDRSMGFTGSGTSTVKIEVGKTVRAQDRTYAMDEAIGLAVTDALEDSVSKLRANKPRTR